MATAADNLDKQVTVHFSKVHGLGNDFVMLTDQELHRLVAGALAVQGPSEQNVDGWWLGEFCSRLAARLCDRHLSIGGDGLIVAIDLAALQAIAKRTSGSKQKARASEEEVFWLALDQFTGSYPERDTCELAWIYVNSDGSYAEICGNGLRCFTLFVRELGWLTKASCRVATRAYPVTVTVKAEAAGESCTAGSGASAKKQSGRLKKAAGDNQNTAGSIRSDGSAQNGGCIQSIEVVSRLAGPRFSPRDIPLDLAAVEPGLASFVDGTIDVNDLKLKATFVSMGNPHCVIFEQENVSLAEYAIDIKQAHGAGRALLKFPANLIRLAEDIQRLSLIPEGANIEFVRIEPDCPDTAIVFVVERGCGATLACASGAAAVLAAGVKSGRLNKRSYVILPGGKLELSLLSVTEKASVQEYIDLTGPAEKAFSGDVSLPVSVLLDSGNLHATEHGGSAAPLDSSLAEYWEGLCL